MVSSVTSDTNNGMTAREACERTAGPIPEMAVSPAVRALF